jgi:hypothetical protein
VGQPAQVDQPEPPIARAHRSQHPPERGLVFRLVARTVLGAAGRRFPADLPQQSLQEAVEQDLELGMEPHREDRAAAVVVGRGQHRQRAAQERFGFGEGSGGET